MSYYCSVCKDDITAKEYKYSNDKYGKALCRKHQKSPKQVENPSGLRKATNEANRLYVALTELGWDVESESDDGYKHVDLAISEAQMDIEVDGQHHNTNAKQALADIKRTYHSFRTGVFTLRIPNTLVNDQERLVETAKYLDKLLNERVEQLEKDRKDKKFASIGRFIFYILLVYAIINILQLL